MTQITRNGDTITVDGKLILTVIPSPAPSAERQAEIRRSGWVPQMISFSGEQCAEPLERNMNNWLAMGWTLNLRQKDGSLLKIDLRNPPAASFTIKADGLEVQ